MFEKTIKELSKDIHSCACVGTYEKAEIISRALKNVVDAEIAISKAINEGFLSKNYEMEVENASDRIDQ